MRLRFLFLFAVMLLALGLAPALAAAQMLGDSKVIAPVPLPGFPEGIATRGHRFYVSGPAAFGQPLGSAFIQSYDIRTGTLDAIYKHPFVRFLHPLTRARPKAPRSVGRGPRLA